MANRPPFQRLSATETPAWLAVRPNALVLDARKLQHHAQSHLFGSLHLDGRNHENLLLFQPKERPVFLYCYHGEASQTYAQTFADFGFREVCDLVGGWEAWQQMAITALQQAAMETKEARKTIGG